MLCDFHITLRSSGAARIHPRAAPQLNDEIAGGWHSIVALSISLNKPAFPLVPNRQYINPILCGQVAI